MRKRVTIVLLFTAILLLQYLPIEGVNAPLDVGEDNRLGRGTRSPEGENWLTGWDYRKSHNLIGATGAGTNYQMGIKVYYGDGGNSWQTRANMTHKATDNPTAVSGGKLYTFGGWGTGASDELNWTQEYDPSTDTWTDKKNMTTARWGAGAAEISGDIYVFGGAADAVGQNAAECYDVSGDSWSTKTNLPSAISNDGIMAVTVGSLIYLFLGWKCYEFNPAGNGGDGSYTEKTDAPVVREWATCGYVNVGGEDRIYIIGGYDGSDGSDTNYYYRPTQNDWSSAQAVAPYESWGQTRDNPVYNDKIYYGFGQHPHGIYFAYLYAYTPSTNTWSAELASASYARDGIGCGFIGDKLYCVGGREDTNSFDYTESYAVNSHDDYGQYVYLNDKCESGFGDLRATDDDGSSELHYCIVNQTDGERAEVWVNVTDDLGSNQIIYLYYGKSGATTTSNITNTFIFGDDFSGASVDWTNRWQSSDQSSYSQSGGKLAVAQETQANDMIHSQSSYSNVCYETLYKEPNAGGQLYLNPIPTAGVYDSDEQICLAWDVNQIRIRISATSSNLLSYENTTHYHRAKFEIPTSGDARGEVWIGDLLLHSSEDVPDNTVNYIGFLQWVAGTGYVDFVFVRKWQSSEPTHGSWGSEETSDDLSVDVDSDVDSVGNVGTADYTYLKAKVLDGAYQNITENKTSEDFDNDFVDDNTGNVDSSADNGTHSDFSEEKDIDSFYDYLNESDTAENFTNDIVDSDSTDVDSSPDNGTHDTFADQKDGPDGTFDTMTEGDTAEEFDDDAIDDNTGDVGGDGDKGTHSNFDNEKALDTNMDTLTEGDFPEGGVDEYRYVDAYSDVLWTEVGADPYLNAQDEPTNYIWTDGNGDYTGWCGFADTSGTGSGFTVTMSFYWYCDGDGYIDWELDWTGDSVADASGSYPTQGIYDWSTTGTISGLDTATEINACTLRLRNNKGAGGPDNSYADAGRLYITQSATTNYRLDLEVRFDGANCTQDNEELCIFTGSQNAEALRVEVWDGSWNQVIADLTADAWNNVSVSAYLTTNILNIRFLDDTQTGDSSQGTWEIDYVILHCWNNTNYQLDLEVQFVGANCTQDNEELCIYTGTQDAEALKVDVWTGSAWTNVIADLSASSWNNVSVTTWLTSPTITFRFKGNTETGDGSESAWNIDVSLLHCWNDTSYELDLEIKFTGANHTQDNEQLCIRTGTQDAENLQVDVWDGAQWQTVIADLTASAWNNVSITSYLTSSTLNVRYKGTSESGDTTQGSWQIDGVLLHTWNSTNYEIYWEHQCLEVISGSYTYNVSVYGNVTDAAENVSIELWNGSDWNTVLPKQINDTLKWVNNSVPSSTYVVDNNLTWRYNGTDESSDSTQTTLKVDWAGYSYEVYGGWGVEFVIKDDTNTTRDGVWGSEPFRHSNNIVPAGTDILSTDWWYGSGNTTYVFNFSVDWGDLVDQFKGLWAVGGGNTSIETLDCRNGAWRVYVYATQNVNDKVSGHESGHATDQYGNVTVGSLSAEETYWFKAEIDVQEGVLVEGTSNYRGYVFYYGEGT